MFFYNASAAMRLSVVDAVLVAKRFLILFKNKNSIGNAAMRLSVVVDVLGTDSQRVTLVDATLLHS
jgi:hypothetical protein